MTVTKQNEFSRALSNDAKMGAYYTDVEHCKWISNFFDFPDDEVCALEPSIGDGVAIKAATRKGENENVKIFGIELNNETAIKTKKDPQIEEILNADFLNGIRVSNSAFSFCFSNPPYGVDDQAGRGERLEKSFLEKITIYLKTGGALVYIIPYSVFADERFLKTWCARYTTAHVYRFHEKEFQKYKQLAVLGIRKGNLGFFKQEFEELQNSVMDLDKIPLLPTEYDGERIKVKPSYSANIDYFTTKSFNLENAKTHLYKSGLYKVASDKLSQKEYLSCELSSPPIRLKKDLMYLLAVSGGGQGLAGNEEKGDLHLQRGNVKIVETSNVEPTESENFQERVRSSSSITMTIIENSGKITRFN